MLIGNCSLGLGKGLGLVATIKFLSSPYNIHDFCVIGEPTGVTHTDWGDADVGNVIATGLLDGIAVK
jgi:hypothetical protein